MAIIGFLLLFMVGKKITGLLSINTLGAKNTLFFGAHFFQLVFES